MYKIIYISHLKKPFKRLDFVNVLVKSRLNNLRLGVTGVLIYNDFIFIQYLEGEKSNVIRLMDKISVDSRHYNIVYLFHGVTTTKRIFNTWGMGFSHITAENSLKIIGIEQSVKSDIIKKVALHEGCPAADVLLNILKLNNK